MGRTSTDAKTWRFLVPVILAALAGVLIVAFLGAVIYLHVETRDYKDMFHALRKNDTTAVKCFLIKGADPNQRDRHNATALHLLARGANIEMAEAVIRHGANVNAWRSGRTALHGAALLGNVEMVELLLEHGADPNASKDSGPTPLHTTMLIQLSESACFAEKTAITELLILAGADVNTKCTLRWFREDLQDVTPLQCAAMHGRLECVKMLLEERAELNARTASGELALDLAVKVRDPAPHYYGLSEIEPGLQGTIEYLISAGAQPGSSGGQH